MGILLSFSASMPQLLMLEATLLYPAITVLLLFRLGTEGVEGHAPAPDTLSSSALGREGKQEKVLDFPSGRKLSFCPSFPSNKAFVLETIEVLVICGKLL